MALTKVSYTMINGSLLNVADYGVTGSGDETALICQAMNDAYNAGKTLVFPEGAYTISAGNMPGGTNYAPAMYGDGIVTINLSGAVVFQIGNGFSLENLNFVTTYTYPNSTATYYYLFTTGAKATSPRLFNSYVRNVTYKQTTITDGSERAYGFMTANCGATNFSADNVSFIGCREGIVFDGDGHDGETVSLVNNARFTQTYAENVQRVYVFNSIPTTGNFGNVGIDIDDFIYINNSTQRDNYSGGDRTGKSSIIGDLGLNPRLNNLRIQYGIEHAMYISASRAVISNFYGSNSGAIKLTGYSETEKSSASIHVAWFTTPYPLVAVTHPIVILYHVDGVSITVDRFEGKNTTDGSGNLIRPWSIVELSRSGKNITITANGQYLNRGVLSYDTGSTQVEAFENIVIKDCFILDPNPSTNSTTSAALNQTIDGDTPTLPWWTSPGGALIKNVSVLNNYFGVTTDTAGSATTTTVIGRGRCGTKLADMANFINCAGATLENNICDGWVGRAASGSTSHINVNQYCSAILFNDTVNGPANTNFDSVISNFPGVSPSSNFRYKSVPATTYLSQSATINKGFSSTLTTASGIGPVYQGADVDLVTVVKLAAGASQNVGSNANFDGELSFQTDTGEYAYGNIAGATITGFNVSANAAFTDTASKISVYTSSTSIVAKNNTAGTVIVTIKQKGSYYA